MGGGCGIEIPFLESDLQGAETTHRSSPNRPPAAARPRSIRLFNVLHQVSRDEVFVIPGAIDVVCVETVVALGMNHEDLWNLFLSDELVHLLMNMAVAVYRPTRMVVVQTMQEVHHGVVAIARRVGRRQVDGKLPFLLQSRAGKGAELNFCATGQLDGTAFCPAAFTGGPVLRRGSL